MTYAVARKLVELLSDGLTHSGRSLGGDLGISRAAVHKHITGLRELGLDVQGVVGGGYCLSKPLELLDREKITTNLADNISAKIDRFELTWSIPSTNDFLVEAIKNRKVTSSGAVCLTEHQSSGRGRRGKFWVSPFASNLYLSIAWRFEDGTSVLDGLSLSLAMQLVQSLQRAFNLSDLKIKWPNDIVLKGQKLGGILIDVMGEAAGPCWVVVGLGINVLEESQVMRQIDQPWVGLSALLEGGVSRNYLASIALNAIVNTLMMHESQGFAIENNEWKKYDAYFGKQVFVIRGDGDVFSGVSKGISRTGCLVVDVDGVSRIVSAGEVSLRSA